ncbi:MAG: hypothetical protein JWO59_3042, partial [Chloroflexi bacterium]|nr:hypothetical protein [Chloroflexota bacterium]
MRYALVIEALKEPRYFEPVLASFVHALPRTVRDVDAPPGACLRLVICGPAGGRWIALRTA